jgi:hypothetical protein
LEHFVRHHAPFAVAEDIVLVNADAQRVSPYSLDVGLQPSVGHEHCGHSSHLADVAPHIVALLGVELGRVHPVLTLSLCCT